MNSGDKGALPLIWGVIPAAGIGQRMQSDIPKQYLTIGNKTVLQHSCERLLELELVCGLMIAVRDDDSFWPATFEAIKAATDKPVLSVQGGKERADSVYNALQCLQDAQLANASNCWALVHDAVRPCVRTQDIQRLIDDVTATADGGLLAVPVRDTMKRADAQQQVAATVERDKLWHALTPQCFPLPALQQALHEAASKGLEVTDEASAMELTGHKPLLVQGADDNIKITRADDLKLAQFYLDENSS